MAINKRYFLYSFIFFICIHARGFTLALSFNDFLIVFVDKIKYQLFYKKSMIVTLG